MVHQNRSQNIFHHQRIILDNLKELNALTPFRLWRTCFVLTSTVASSLGSSEVPPTSFLTNNAMKKPSRPSSGSVRSKCSAAKQMREAVREATFRDIHWELHSTVWMQRAYILGKLEGRGGATEGTVWRAQNRGM
jgi:hypothetical protein